MYHRSLPRRKLELAQGPFPRPSQKRASRCGHGVEICRWSSGPSGRPRWRRSALTRGFAVDRRHFDDCAVGELMLTRCEASRLARWCRQRGQRCRVVLLLPELVLPDEQPAEDTPAAQRPTSPLLPIDKALATPLPALSTATMPAMHVGGVCGGHATATQEGAHAPQSPQRRLRGRGAGVPCGPSSLRGCCTGRGC